MLTKLLTASEKDQPAFAAILIAVALAFLSFQDGLVKFVSDDTSLWQFQVFRSAFNILFITGALALAGHLALIRPKRIGPVLARSLVMVGTMIFFFSGAPFLSLAEMGAGLYTYPVFNTILAVVILRERVGIWRAMAVTLSVAGALFIIRPGSEGFHIAQFLPICAGFCYSINSLILRSYCRSESPVTMALWSASGFFLAGITGILVIGMLAIEPSTRSQWPFLLEAWPTLLGAVVGFAAFASICNVIGNILIVKAYQSAELSWLAPIDYFYLLMAAIWGVVLFGTWPDFFTGIGMVLIAAGGILTAWREAKRQRALSSSPDHNGQNTTP